MESAFLMKIQYGDTLRRFNARTGRYGGLDLDMVRLKAKVVSLFNFPPNSGITMTYVDEDGENVTLVDDDDLKDVMRQRLKFLRIKVVLNSGSSTTPMMSPCVQQPFPDMNAIAEALKSEPQPLHEGLSKISLDAFASKAASASPGFIAELFESFAKLGKSFMNLDAQSEGLRLVLSVEDSKLTLTLAY